MKEGTCIRSLSGRDKGKLMFVVGETEKGLLVCDGKERPLERPKLKNPKHVKELPYSAADKFKESNRAIRKMLREIEMKQQ